MNKIIFNGIIVLAAFTALSFAFCSSAYALPCLNKLERGADHYRIVDGAKCWYVGERRPGKDEFAPRNRKEVVRRADRSQVVSRPDNAKPAAASKLAPLQALVGFDESAWMKAERPEYLFEALCADRCGELRGKVARVSSADRVKDAFESIASAGQVSWLWVRP